jgi:signal transduction histidine kinase
LFKKIVWQRKDDGLMDEIEILRQRVQQLEKELAEARESIPNDFFEMVKRPLVPIRGFVRTLIDDEKEEWYTCEDRREFYTIIEHSADRMERLINDLKDGSYRKKTDESKIAMNWQHVDVLELIQSVVAENQKRAGKHKLVLHLDTQHVLIETDPEKFAVMITNLIRDAIKYSPDGSDVHIITRLEPTCQEYPYGSLLLQVVDSGSGICKEDLSKLGSVFDTRSGRRDIKAVGLYLVRMIVEAHHGVVWPESEGRGKGTTFSVRLPVKQPGTKNEKETGIRPTD